MTTQIKFNTRHGLSVGSAPFSVLDNAGNATFNTITAGLWNGTIISGTYGGTGVNNGTKTITLGGNLVTSGAFNTTLTVGATTNVTLPASGTLATTENLSQFASTTSAQLKGIISDETGADGSSLVFATSPTLNTITVNGTNSASAVTLGGGTVTVSKPPIDITQTWNDAGVAFSGIKCVITNTASASNSKVIDFTIGNNKFGVDATGAITQILSTPNLARDIVGFTGSRHVREYQDLNDWNTVQGIGGATTNTENFEWGFTWNAKWDTTQVKYIKDRNNANDHAVMFRIDKKFRNQWWFSDGTTPGEILWVKKIDFDFPNNECTFLTHTTFSGGLAAQGAVSFGTTTTGNLTVNGDFIVNGTSTTINTSELNVDDINITLGSVATPTDTTANGGGITLLGSTNKTITWNQGTTNWDSSENLNVATGKSFRINNNIVLSQTTLGSIVLSSSLTSVGALSSGSIASGFGSINVGANTITAASFVGDLTSCTSNTETANNNSTQLATTAYADRLTAGTLPGAFTTLSSNGSTTFQTATDHKLWLAAPTGYATTGISLGSYNSAGNAYLPLWVNALSFGVAIEGVEKLSVSSTGLAVTGTISGTSIQNTPIGSTTASTGAFTTLSANSYVEARAGSVHINSVSMSPGDGTHTGSLEYYSAGGYRQGYIGYSATNFAVNDTGTLPYVAGTHAFSGSLAVTGTISGTSIQNTPIGSTTASTGAFTTLSASGDVSASSVSLGAAVATVGQIRLKVGHSVAYRNASNTTDLNLVIIGTGNILTFGSNDNGYINFNTSQTHRFQYLGTTIAEVSSTGLAVTGTINASGNITISGAGSLKGSYGAGGITSNVAIGDGALVSNTTGTYNTASGMNALFSNTTGYQNTASGQAALYSNTTGYQNTASGMNALFSNTTGYYNTASGMRALYSNTTGYQNTASGQAALYSNTTGNYNTASGQNALYSNTTGFQNTANGVNALYSNTTGNYNTASGVNALYSNTTGTHNTASGMNALFSNTTGYQNTASGQNALYSNTTGFQNTANGVNALYSNTTGTHNTASGMNALFSNTTGNYNTVSGVNALYSNTTGYCNTASGQAALYSNTTGNYNTVSGVNAGYNSGVSLQTNNNCVFLGYSANTSVDGLTNCVVIGAFAQGTASNQVTLGNASITSTILRGDVVASGAISASNFSGTSSGTNTGDQTNISGNAGTATRITGQSAPALSGNIVGARSLNVTYTNSTGHCLLVSITVSYGNPTDSTFYIRVNGIDVGHVTETNYYGAWATGQSVLSMLVPNGASYGIFRTAGDGGMLGWYENRF